MLHIHGTATLIADTQAEGSEESLSIISSSTCRCNFLSDEQSELLGKCCSSASQTARPYVQFPGQQHFRILLKKHLGTSFGFQTYFDLTKI